MIAKVRDGTLGYNVTNNDMFATDFEVNWESPKTG
jgi:hypothetical protein